VKAMRPRQQFRDYSLAELRIADYPALTIESV
jgi:hypothetical protein